MCEQQFEIGVTMVYLKIERCVNVNPEALEGGASGKVFAFWGVKLQGLWPGGANFSTSITAAETVALPRSKSFCRRAIYETYIDFTLCSEETDELEAEFVALRQKLLLRARAMVSAAVRISDSARLGDPRARQIQMFILTATFLIAGFIQLMHQHPRCASM